LRGFVRNYAKAVNVDADEALAILERTNQAASIVLASKQVTPVPAADKINVTPNARSLPVPGARIGIAFLVAALIGAAGYYWWNFMRPGASANAKGDASAKLSAANVDTASIVTPSVAAPTATTTEVAPPTILPSATQATNAGATPVAQPSAESAGPATPASAPTSPTALPASAPFTASDSASTSSPVAPQLNLTPRTRGNVVGFTFTGESWVEVTDATGRIVLSKRFKSGDAEEVAGRAPFSIVVGNASATRMAFNGKEVDLRPHTKIAVARLTVK
jgi:cytoskeleton protein RodZ